MGSLNFNDKPDFHLIVPKIAQGTVIPHKIEEKMMLEEKEKRELKRARRHDWLIAIFGTVGGVVGGLISSLVFWLITR